LDDLEDANKLFRCYPLFYRLNVRDYTIWCAICLEGVGYYGEDKDEDNEVEDGKDRNDKDEDDKGEDDEVG
jgi:hypothetical protein